MSNDQWMWMQASVALVAAAVAALAAARRVDCAGLRAPDPIESPR